jgi:GNAT superfamily N-acetyltransferase
MLQKTDLVSVRNVDPDDCPFIYATWLRGLRHGNDFFNDIDQTAYFEEYHKVIAGILLRPNTIISVACLKDDPGIILGYSVRSSQALHWVFVKKAWRGIGIAKSLVPSEINTVTHLTRVGRSLLKKKALKFNPFAL